MEEAAEQVILPDLIDASMSVWNVRTGNYSSSWSADAYENGVTISNDVEYAAPLEYGWTTRNGGFVDSPGVLLPTIQSDIPDFIEALQQWLTSQQGF